MTSKPRLLLGALAGVLALACVLALAARLFSPSLGPSSWTAGDEADTRQVAVTTAARKVTLAFLDVDYRDMDPRVEKVLALATGEFKKQYQATKVNLVAAAREGESTSTGTVRYVGISDIDADAAVVFVAADSKVDNKVMREARAKGQKPDEQRFYRFQLHFTKVGDRWLLDNLEIQS
jgi:Mce-associated membrane protein